MPASINARSAVTVVRRSSKVMTGTPTTVAKARASATAAFAAGPELPFMLSGSPTTSISASSSTTSWRMTS